ncbi:unnamed protein product [Tilletia caries]|nr:unnamed protein product [Tilletia caries]
MGCITHFYVTSTVVLCITSASAFVGTAGVLCITSRPFPLLHLDLGVCAPQGRGTALRANLTASAAVQEDNGEKEVGTGEGGGTDGEEEEEENDGQRAMRLERMVIRWHQRFAHMSFSSIARLIGLGVEGLKHLNKSAALRLVDREDRCDACAISNLKESSFKASDSRAAHRGDLVHCDLSGPYAGNGEYTYALSILDDHSRKGWTFPISDKSSGTVTKVLQRV